MQSHMSLSGKHLEDKRNRMRHPFDHNILCFNYIASSSCETQYTAVRIKVKDISYGGIGISSDKKLEIGDILVFNLTTPTQKREIMAQVKWRMLDEKHYKMGLEFYQLKRDDLMLIHELINKAQKAPRK